MHELSTWKVSFYTSILTHFFARNFWKEYSKEWVIFWKAFCLRVNFRAKAILPWGNFFIYFARLLIFFRSKKEHSCILWAVAANANFSGNWIAVAFEDALVVFFDRLYLNSILSIGVTARGLYFCCSSLQFFLLSRHPRPPVPKAHYIAYVLHS